MKSKALKVLVIDIGGTHVKVRVSGEPRTLKLPSGPTLTPQEMVMTVHTATAQWSYDAVSIGYPGPVENNGPDAEPHNLGPGWVGFSFEAAFGPQVRVINDAAMQALGGYRGGHMLFMGLGTGLGTALILEGHLQPLELAHLPYRRRRTFEQFVSDARFQRRPKRWLRSVFDVVARLKAALQADYVLLGGGNARHLRHHLDHLPPGTRIGSNADAFRGGVRIWQTPEVRAKVRRVPKARLHATRTADGETVPAAHT